MLLKTEQIEKAEQIKTKERNKKERGRKQWNKKINIRLEGEKSFKNCLF